MASRVVLVENNGKLFWVEYMDIFCRMKLTRLIKTEKPRTDDASCDALCVGVMLATPAFVVCVDISKRLPQRLHEEPSPRPDRRNRATHCSEYLLAVC